MEREYVDPVCGMTVDPETASAKIVHNEETWYFCSTHCLQAFQADPDQYTGASGS